MQSIHGEYEISHCDTKGYYVNDAGYVANNPNLLAANHSQIEEEAVCSVLQFGTIVPPLSPWKEIRRLLPGYKYRETEIVSPVKLEKYSHIAGLSDIEQVDVINKELDSILRRRIGENIEPVLLFSGGVDSGIIASRLAAIGYDKSLLINYSFGDDDEQSKLAESMAKKLGLRFERIIASSSSCDCLENPGQVYPQPFADHSTAPTYDFALKVIKLLSDKKYMVLDGIGADGGFGMSQKVNTWGRLGLVPNISKPLVSYMYRNFLWKNTGGLEYIARILLRSIEMPKLSAILAQNPLSGYFYTNDFSQSIDDRLESWVSGWAGNEFAIQAVAGDLTMTCANIFAQKSNPIIEGAGHRVIQPFMEMDLVSLAISASVNWNMDEPKAPLKRSLSKYVPSNMVYRTKSGFVDPHGRVFYENIFIEYLRSAAESTSPIENLLKKKPILDACDLLAKKKPLPAQTLNALWAIVFTDRWYRTAII